MKKTHSKYLKPNTSVDNTTPIDNTLNHIILTVTDGHGSRSISRDNENACRSRRVIRYYEPHTLYTPPPPLRRNSPGSREKSASRFRPRGSRMAAEHVIGNVESISLLHGATLRYIQGVNI